MISKKSFLVFLLPAMLLENCIFLHGGKLSGKEYELFQNTPAWKLAKAVRSADEDEVKEILSEDSNLINYQEPKYGETLLMLTIKKQEYDSFMILLRNGADVNIHDTYTGSSALMLSVEYPDYNLQFAKALIAHGAKVNDIEVGERKEWNNTRRTPLIAAVSSRKVEFVSYLLDCGADINYQNEYEQTALSKSLLLGYMDIGYLLLQHGADYKRPIFFRPDYSIPNDLLNKTYKGKPMYITNVLREKIYNLTSQEYKYKMQIVAFLQKRGLSYKDTPIPEFVKKRIIREHPHNWEQYLEKY